ncbi:type I restriction enzyme, S subunit [Xylanibacter ruminicola]|uniref:restriction endonuclease subunit S n=1 Tax=Xylanibacter ruminicola TaxID=839 RepID=UPI0008E4C366|nr:restriction endonuclease subunit S [Xylanibacter ruminicola]SFC80890.1 type I restriction enzyme, S subunit [Xylanibacter ruminicola]
MIYKFGDIANNVTEKRSPKPEDSQNYIGLEHLDSGSLYVNRYGIDVELKGDKLVMHKGDVLLGKRNAYLRRAAIAPHDGLFSAHGMILRPKDVIASEFFPFFIASDKFFDDVIRISVGGLSPTVNWKDLKELEFDLPSLAEQKVLAEKLWAAYEVKQSYLKMIAATEEMVKLQFIEMFGSPYVGWKYPTKSLGDVYHIGTGGTPDRKISSYYEGQIPWVKSTEVNYCELYDTEEHISEQAINDSNCSLYPSGTILLAMYGQGTTRGRVALLRTDATVNQAIAAIQVQDETESLFLYSMLKVCYDFVRNLAVGGNQHNLNLKLVSSIPIVFPPKELQQKFVSIAHQSDKSISELRKSVDAIDKVIKSLINENL